MFAIEEVVGKMRPAVDELVLYLQQTGQEQAHAFFLEVQRRLQYVSEEDDLLELFMMLSMTAFQGFALDPFGAMLADRILAYAEQVSHTFSADNDAVH